MLEPLEQTYTFSYTDNKGDCVEITTKNDVSWPDLLEKFEQFLRGCGFYMDGHFELVDDEPSEEIEEVKEVQVDSAFVDAVAERVEQKIQQDFKSGFFRLITTKEEVNTGNPKNA